MISYNTPNEYWVLFNNMWIECFKIIETIKDYGLYLKDRTLWYYVLYLKNKLNISMDYI